MFDDLHPEPEPKAADPSPCFEHEPDLLHNHLAYCRRILKTAISMRSRDRTAALAVAVVPYRPGPFVEARAGSAPRETVVVHMPPSRAFERGRDLGFQRAFILNANNGFQVARGIPKDAPANWLKVDASFDEDSGALMLVLPKGAESSLPPSPALVVLEASSTWGVVVRHIERLISAPETFPLRAARFLLNFPEEDAVDPMAEPLPGLSIEQSTAAAFPRFNEATFIWGPPGTGKSTVLSEIIAQDLDAQFSILAAASSNHAVDSLAESVLRRKKDPRIADVIDFGKVSRLGEKSRFSQAMGRKKRKKKDLVAAALNPTGQLEFSTIFRQFLRKDDGTALIPDTIVIDEAGLVSPPLLYCLACMARKRIVICGDPMQGDPVFEGTVRDVGSEALTLWRSNIFQTLGFRLDGSKEPRVCRLSVQHRMPDEVAEYVRETRLYPAYLSPENPRKPTDPERAALGSDPMPWVHVSVADSSRTGAVCTGHQNSIHFDIATNLALRASAAGAGPVGIIAPYRAQAQAYAAWTKGLQETGPTDILCGTVHAFQGSECPYVIFDTTEGPGPCDGHFWTDELRNAMAAKILNVAVSRSRSKLVFIANVAHISKSMTPGCYLQRALTMAAEQGAIVPAGAFTRQAADRFPENPRSFQATNYNVHFKEDCRASSSSIDILSVSVEGTYVAAFGNFLRKTCSPTGTIVNLYLPRRLPLDAERAVNALDQSIFRIHPYSHWPLSDAFVRFDGSLRYVSASGEEASPLAGRIPDFCQRLRISSPS